MAVRETTPAAGQQATEHPHIDRVPGVCGGEPKIRGTRIPVWIIAGWHNQHMSMDEIMAMYSHLSAAQVFDALSYYYDHKADVDAVRTENKEHSGMVSKASILSPPRDDRDEMTLATPLILHAPPAWMDDDEFFDFCQRNSELWIEQTAEGDLVIMTPAGGETGSRNSEIARQLGNWARQDGAGIAFDSSTGFILPNRAKRSPDAAWVPRLRLAALTPAQKQKFLPLCPDFVVELRSPTDRLPFVEAKMVEYRDNGARLGWLIDPTERRVQVYRPAREVESLDAPERVAADPELPGFVLELQEIWEPGF